MLWNSPRRRESRSICPHGRLVKKCVICLKILIGQGDLVLFSYYLCMKINTTTGTYRHLCIPMRSSLSANRFNYLAFSLFYMVYLCRKLAEVWSLPTNIVASSARLRFIQSENMPVIGKAQISVLYEILLTPNCSVYLLKWNQLMGNKRREW